MDQYDDVMLIRVQLRPISCVPLSRDREHPENIGLNDVLGNYSLTLIDSLSTLAVLASSPTDRSQGNGALEDFQQGVRLLVEQYGDGTTGAAGQGIHARGFDLDSKVQVFETIIRGVGGLLSAHLFAVGDLPIRQYDAGKVQRDRQALSNISEDTIVWPGGFQYSGQLLRLAVDLGRRLLPAFYSPTGLPYPRVNLRHGIPFYVNSPLYRDAEYGECGMDKPLEITETCSAGAGSLLLEFTTLTRLTGDTRFETVAKRAFWELWARKGTSTSLVGSGIDSDTGQWTSGTTGVSASSVPSDNVDTDKTVPPQIGAGVDSFFEYAFKSHVLLSGLGHLNNTYTQPADPNSLLRPLTEKEEDPNSFLEVWQEAHSAIKRHLYRDLNHPHYINVHLNTGSPLAPWIDSLSAFYPGLLALAGELDEAVETHLLYTALWTRYAALPERWSVRDGDVEGGLSWWPLRPELAESTYYLYRATQDPWYLHVGEMILEDIKRRCWTKCGWAGIQDVRTGELADRMESFFLGETTKYLYLLFDITHPLNTLDASFVFSTEGHPLIISRQRSTSGGNVDSTSDKPNEAMCPTSPEPLPLTISSIAARDDLFHAAGLARLQMSPNTPNLTQAHAEGAGNILSSLGVPAPMEYNFFPWTMPSSLIPLNGTCSKLQMKYAFEIEFPAQSEVFSGQQSVTRVPEGLFMKTLSGLKLAVVMDEPPTSGEQHFGGGDLLRIYSVGNIPLGRGEKVFVHGDELSNTDPNFYKTRDAVVTNIVVETDETFGAPNDTGGSSRNPSLQDSIGADLQPRKPIISSLLEPRDLFNFILKHITAAPSEHADTQSENYHRLVAVVAAGIGAQPIPDMEDVPAVDTLNKASYDLPWRTIYLGDKNCHGKLPDAAATEHQVIVLRRGECSFSEKLMNIPSFRQSSKSLQLVIIVSDGDDNIRPMLDQIQYTPGGLVRYAQIPMVMVGGGDKTYDLLAKAKGIGLRRRYFVQSQGIIINNLIVV